MSGKIDWQRQIGRRLKLRDLHVFQTIAECGSMAKAAQKLGVSQPTVSEVIADLEHTFGVRLLDRSSRGVELTIYGNALLKRSVGVFDELKQSSRDIDFLANPTVGEVRVASAEGITATVLPPVIQRFAERYPRVVLHIDDVPSRVQELSALQERKYDLVLLRMQARPADDPLLSAAGDLIIEPLFEDRLVIAAGAHSRWARRRKIDLAELADQPWILTAFLPVGPATWNFARVAEAFQARGLPFPKVSIVTSSVHLRTSLLLDSPFITAIPQSFMLLSHAREVLKVLPVDLPPRPWPVAIVTLKNRTLSPVVERFIDCARDVAKSIAARMAPVRS
jgi:DNA-binding transcriptional LysR family regulator